MKTTTDGHGLAVGSHFADDGNTWLGPDGKPCEAGYGAEIVAYPDGRIEINAGCKWEEYGYIATEEESAAIRKLISPDASNFVEFVLRHTWPERASAHGSKTVYDLIVHHPFAKLFAPKGAVGRVEPITGEALLRESMAKFAFYQQQHEDKYRALSAERDKLTSQLEIDGIDRRMRDTFDKAKVNRDMVTKIEAFLGK